MVAGDPLQRQVHVSQVPVGRREQRVGLRTLEGDRRSFRVVLVIGRGEVRRIDDRSDVLRQGDDQTGRALAVGGEQSLQISEVGVHVTEYGRS